MLTKELINNMQKSGPRYTSYPPKPVWGVKDNEWWRDQLNSSSNGTTAESKSFSMYVHVPFCAKQCHYCACNMTVNHDRKEHTRYVNALISEIEQVKKNSSLQHIKQLHFGGGTPTYLSPQELENIIQAIHDNFELAENAEISIEIDPRTATSKHLNMLSRYKFNRVSLGVQDFDENVQKIVGRHQSPEKVKSVVHWARNAGIKSVNFDLIYGLPGQSLESMRNTLEVLLSESPERIAFYSYAHVPRIKPMQKFLEAHGLPGTQEKIEMLLLAREILFAAGYKEIGMDHFALADDPLYLAYENNKLYRNFMGYTIQESPTLIGVGCSAISESPQAFAQNESDWMQYIDRMEAEGLACNMGYSFTPDDLIRKQLILDVMTKFQVDLKSFNISNAFKFEEYFEREREQLRTLQTQGLLELSEEQIKVSPTGKYFVRNIAMVFDAYLGKSSPGNPQYSNTI